MNGKIYLDDKIWNGEGIVTKIMQKGNFWKIVQHPLVESNLVIIRNKFTARGDFCKSIANIAKLLVFIVAQDWETKKIKVHTPFITTSGLTLKSKIILIPILRAGLALLEGFKDLMPQAQIGHIGLYRNKTNFQACEYYFKIPPLNDDDQVVILDPMIATANTAITAIKKLLAINRRCQISLVSVITSAEAQKKLNQTFENIKFYTVSIDPELNAKKYIIPGFGDAGDRFFGTE